MGVACKSIGKFKGIMRKAENELEVQKKMSKRGNKAIEMNKHEKSK